MSVIDEQRRQRALDALGILDTPPDERVDRVTRLARDIFAVPMVSVTLVDRERQWRKSEIGFGLRESPRAGSLCDLTVLLDAPVVVEDAARDHTLRNTPELATTPGMRFYASHPLHAPAGEPIGTLCILDTKVHTFDGDQREMLRELALWAQEEVLRHTELHHAISVQRMLAPHRLPVVDGYTIAAGSIAHDGLSGDFFDVAFDGSTIRVTVADVMGTGTGPALVAAATRASLRTAPTRRLPEAVGEVDRLLSEDLADTAMFVTAVHANIDVPSGRIELVDAGHSLAFVFRQDGSWQRFKSAGLPLGMGMDGSEQREVATAILEPGDAFVCCSDGLLDVLDPADPFGHVARVLRTSQPADAVQEAVRLADSDAAGDDLTVVVVRRDR